MASYYWNGKLEGREVESQKSKKSFFTSHHLPTANCQLPIANC